MPITNYPGGFSHGIALRNMPVFNNYAGNIFWVSSVGGSDGNKGTFVKPFATVNKAISMCTANNDDQIHIKAGHNEAGVAADLFDMDKAGISIIGHGRGMSRPTFDFDDTDVTIGVSADDCYLENVVLRSSVSATVTGILVDGKRFHAHNVSFVEELTGTDEFLNAITTTAVDNSEDGLTVTNCEYRTDSAAAQSFIDISQAMRDLTVVGNIFMSATTTAHALVGTTTTTDVLLNVTIIGNQYSSLGADHSTTAVCIEGTGNHSGIISDNRFGTNDPAGALLVNTGTTCSLCENYVTGDTDLSGTLLPALTVHTS